MKIPKGMGVLKGRSKFLGFLGGIGAFTTLGVGALILGWCVFPISRLVISHPGACQKWNRLCVHYAFKFYLKILLGLRVLKLDLTGLQGQEGFGGHFLMANHPTLLDVVVIMGTIKNLQCVVKGGLWRHFFLQSVVKGAGFLSNDLTPEEFLHQCKETLQNHIPILVFPEGTRTTQGQFPHFLRGFGNLVIALDADIHTLMLTCCPIFLSKEVKWYSILPVCPVFSVCAGRSFSITSFDPLMPRPQRVRLIIRTLQDYYSTYLEDFYG